VLNVSQSEFFDVTIIRGGVMSISPPPIPPAFGAPIAFVDNFVTNYGVLNLTNVTMMTGRSIGEEATGGIVNQSGGAINLSGAVDIESPGIYDTFDYTYFTNHGSLTQVSGSNTITFASFDTSAGTVTNWSGTLSLPCSTALAGTFYAAADAIDQFNSSTNVIPGSPLVLAGPGQFQFVSGTLDLPANTIPKLLLMGGSLQLGPAFQGGAITNLSFAGILMTNPTSAVLPITGTLTVSNCTGLRYDAAGNPLPSGVWENFTVASGGQLIVSYSDLHGAISVAGGGTMRPGLACEIESSGSLTVANNGMVSIVRGDLDLNGPMTNAGTIYISNPPTWFFSDLSIYNDGSPNYFGGLLNQASGIINLANDMTAVGGGGGGKEYFSNQGHLIKSAGTNFSGLWGVPWATNAGAFSVNAGRLEADPFTMLPGSSLNIGITSASNYGCFQFITNIVIGGAFNATLNNGYVPANGAVFSVMTYSTAVGAFSSVGLPASVSWQTAYGPTNFSLTVAAAKPQFIAAKLIGTNLVLSAAGGKWGSNYVVLASTNLTLPLAQWTVLKTNIFDSSGQFCFTNPVTRTKPRQFYLFRQP
jgi:hypothetical protein